MPLTDDDLKKQAVFLSCGHDFMVDPIFSALRAVREESRAPEALKPFAPGFHNGVWGRIKAFIVNGAPTRDEGIALARQITEWQAAIPESVYIADGDRVPPFAGTDVMDGDENRR